MTPRRRAALARLETRLARGAAAPPRRHPGAPVLERRTQTPLSALRATPDGSREPHANSVSESGVPSLPAAIAEQLVAGHLSQRCEPCGITEAAGGSCTSCGRLTGPADWFRGTSRKTQGGASRARAHSTAETAATALETATAEPLRLWEALRYQF
jgi:hypothetical protein